MAKEEKKDENKSEGFFKSPKKFIPILLIGLALAGIYFGFFYEKKKS